MFILVFLIKMFQNLRCKRKGNGNQNLVCAIIVFDLNLIHDQYFCYLFYFSCGVCQRNNVLWRNEVNMTCFIICTNCSFQICYCLHTLHYTFILEVCIIISGECHYCLVLVWQFAYILHHYFYHLLRSREKNRLIKWIVTTKLISSAGNCSFQMMYQGLS